MQKAYAQQDHHLHFEYAPHVRRIWIGEILKVVQQADWPHHFFIFPPSPPQIDFSLLAPVLLAAESLATNFLNLFILEGCLEHAWNSHAATNTDLAHSPLPWSIRTLTALGDISRSSWLPLESTHQGRAFLASISHVISISVSPTELHPHFRARISDYIGPRDRELPRWIMHTPWHSFTSLQSVSLALPYTKPVAPHLAPLASSGLDEQVELLTFPASLIFNHQRRALTEGREGRFPWNDRQITVSRSSKRFYVLVQNWERAWAWGLTG
ncbi:uncharacterized protein EDB91DRAFT_1208393 [Suillus paluster]|uniref:uncharacterized protein n=1 Tax=Suillus paluster TaxID=48578 RepID=UPI001B8674FB|nr:uncharacterized protein EDB91DRAFT_1208393 [Suillus paluster]KAG1726946.1 hypothetical protein EDB91DRAFT_1208393 [Suillus paluster]